MISQTWVVNVHCRPQFKSAPKTLGGVRMENGALCKGDHLRDDSEGRSTVSTHSVHQRYLSIRLHKRFGAGHAGV